MLSIRLGGLLAALCLAAGSNAAEAATCKGDLQIDNFAKFTEAVNTLGDATSDDQSMAAIAANNGVLSFQPKDTNSYYYESFPCVQAKSQGYGGLQFTITYPAGTQFSIEAQTKQNCNTTDYQSEWFIIAGLTGTQQVVTLDLNVFSGSGLDAIVGFVWAGFTVSGQYTMSDVKFVCGRLDTGTLEPPDRFSPNDANSVPPRASPAPRPATTAYPVPLPPADTPIPAAPPSSPLPLPPSPPPPSAAAPQPLPPSSISLSPSSSVPSSQPATSAISLSSAVTSASSISISTSLIVESSSTSTSVSILSSLTSLLPTPTLDTPATSVLSSISSSLGPPIATVIPSSSSLSSLSSSISTSLSPSLSVSTPASLSSTSTPVSTSSASSATSSVTTTSLSIAATSFSQIANVSTSTASTLTRAPSAILSVSMIPRQDEGNVGPDIGEASVSPDVPEATTTRRTIVPTSSSRRPQPTSGGQCQDLLIDDWESQSRLTFLYYNSMTQATSDDGTMKSVVVNNDNTVTLTPQNTDSYFYSQMPCVDASRTYGGISMKVKAPEGSSFSIEMSTSDQCGGRTTKQSFTTRQLGWDFDGTLQSYSFPLSKYSNVDSSKIYMIYLTGFNRGTTLGPMAFYCGDSPRLYPAPAHPVNSQTQYQVAAPVGSAGTLVIDRFRSESSNELGQWHGCEEDCVTSRWASGQVTLQTNDSDLSWYSGFADKCADISAYAQSYLHIEYSGSNKFTISLQQANEQCNPNLKPWPETWDSIEAARYASNTDIYIPMSHFNVNLQRVTTLSFKGFYTTASVTLKRIEIVNSPPSGWRMPNKLPSGNLVFGCKRPNSFAFAIDDGDPALAQEVMEIVRSENIKVTFFTVGLPLEDPSTNLSTVYRDMQARGHQIALHSFTHPKMEGLADYAAIDWEYNNDIAAVSRVFQGLHTPYFRPPFGTEGARMRQRLAVALNVTDPYLVMWSVDVEDWLWGTSNTPEKQLEAFKRDLNRGGTLVVMHYLYPNTVKYLRQFIQLAKATGKQLMRVDQCMMDPRAPPLSGSSSSDPRMDSPIS